MIGNILDISVRYRGKSITKLSKYQIRKPLVTKSRIRVMQRNEIPNVQNIKNMKFNFESDAELTTTKQVGEKE